MKPLRVLATSAFLLVFLLSACGAGEPQELSGTESQVATKPENIPPSKQESAPSPVPLQDSASQQEPGNNSSPLPREIAEKAKADLAAYLNIEVDQIKVAEIQAVEWPDASLGCPQQDTMYAQVLTPGFIVRFDVNGKAYKYHTDELENVILCEATYEAGSSSKNTRGSVQDGWPNQTKDRDVIIITPTPRK